MLPKLGLSLVPDSLRRRTLSVAIISTVAANLLCAVLTVWQSDLPNRRLQELIGLASLANLPVGLCLFGWIVTASAPAGGYSPEKIQLATILMFFGTFFPLLTTALNVRLMIDVLGQLQALF